MQKKNVGYSVAIDGPAGAGKSTIAKQIAKQNPNRLQSLEDGWAFLFYILVISSLAMAL